MSAFFVKRLAETFLLLLLMSFVIYALIGLMPGDPIDLMLSADPNITAADAARLKALQGLDQPLLDRYLAWLQRLLSGDLGYSRLYGEPVLNVLGPRLANSLVLMGISLLLAFLLAIPAGVIAAHKRGTLIDHAINLFAFAGFSLPSFWLALLLIILFSVTLGWLPASGVAPVGEADIFDRIRHLVLPVTALTLLTAGTFIRFIRSSMIETLREDYVRTAKAMGFSTNRLIWRQALRNAMMPVVTVLALHFGSLLSGALVVETIFAYLGMGKLIYDSILGNDYNLALAALLLATTVTLLANLAADLAYAYLDPRIAYDR